MEGLLGGAIKTPDVDVYEKERRNSVLTMSGRKVEKEGESGEGNLLGVNLFKGKGDAAANGEQLFDIGL